MTVYTVKRLNLFRKEVMYLDKQLIRLLGRRFSITGKIQRLKKAFSIAINQKEREQALLVNYQIAAEKKGIQRACIKKIFTTIFYYSKKYDILKR